jgi:hypothetical protein
MSMQFARYFRAGLTLLGLVGFLWTPARAEIVAISAVDFQLLCPPIAGCANNAEDFRFNNGLLIPGNLAHFYANVPFPVNGQRVCSFTLVYQDLNNANPMFGRLLKKTSLAGTNPTGPFVVMASVQSAAGVVSATRRATTTAITQPVINKAAAFYIAEVEVQTINTNFLGVLIDVRPTCD